MILTAWGPATAYRMHSPRWAVAPTSGAGAALQGGRANRRGVPALYLSLDTATAISEYQQTSSLLPPGTLISYSVRLGRVVDFRNGYTSQDWDPLWEDFVCDWRELWFNQRVEPPSWNAADEAIAAGAQGILFRSQVAPPGMNLVVFTETMGAGDEVTAYDPDGSLPKSQDSWG